MKTCTRCGENPKAPGHRSWCRSCLTEATKSYRKRNLESCRQRDRDGKRRAAYGLTQSDFRSLIEDQGNRCAICRDEFTETPNVDHDHLTGEVRGLLCRRCNAGLGAFRDSMVLLKRAARYLAYSAMRRVSYRLAEYLEGGAIGNAIETTARELQRAS